MKRIKHLPSIADTSMENTIQYTHIDKCSETIENANAAVSILECPSVGSNKLSIIIQSPTIFTIQLRNQNVLKESEFNLLSNELPLETGNTIEWHLKNNEPQFMIFRLRWSSKETPFDMNEYLTVSKIGSEIICTFATIDIRTTKNANEKARRLLQDTDDTPNAYQTPCTT